ncbi:MAG: signal peptidase I [Actinobacteria bacterium]|nr:signal peptidase I [Actinomycetota bacterium]
MNKRNLAASAMAVFATGLSAFALLAGATVVSTAGNSMEPGFHTGDLAILRPADRYAVGDVAAYHSAELETVVMHRIVAIEDDRFVLQGDNNTWLDPETPTSDEMVGTLALRVPQGGMWLERLTSGPILGLVAFTVIAGGGAAVGSRRRSTRRPDPRATTPTPAGPRARRSRPAHAAARASRIDRLDPSPIAAVSLVLALGGGALAGMAFTRPLLTTGTVDYDERATLSYHATVPAGPVYRDGEIRTGDVVFRKITDRVELAVDWEIATATDDPADVPTGTAVLTAEIADSAGWRHRLPIAESTIEGRSGSVEGTLDLGQLQRAVSAMQKATGTTNASQTITVTADLQTEAHIAGTAVTTRFSPDWVFALDALRLQPASGADGDDPFVATQTGTVVVPDAAPAQLALAGRSLAVSHARAAGIVASAAGLVTGVAALVLAWRRRRRSPAQVLRSRHGHRLVEAVGLAPAPGRTVVQLGSLEALGALAERLDLPIVKAPMLDGDTTYVVDDLSTQYRVRQRGTG